MIALRPKQTRRFILASEDLERDSKIIKGSGGVSLYISSSSRVLRALILFFDF